MLAVAPTILALLAVAGMLVVAIRWRSSPPSPLHAASAPMDAVDPADPLVRGVRIRMLTAVVVALVVALALSRLNLGEVAAGAALGPGVGGALGLLVLAGWPVSRVAPANGIRRAELIPRARGTHDSRWALVPPIAALAALAVLLVVTGASGSTVDGPYSHEILVTIPGGSSSAGPYPDWSYGVFVLSGAILLLAAMLFSLHRITVVPRMAPLEATGLDAALRATMRRFVLLSGTAVLVLYLGAVSLTAGSAATSASTWYSLKPSVEAREELLCGHKTSCSFTGSAADTISGVVQPSYALGMIGAILGIILIGLAIALALLALTNVTVRRSTAATVEPVEVHA